MGLKVSTPPAEEPVSLTELKAQLRIDGTDSDVLLTLHLQAARESVENFTRRAIITQTLTYVLSAFPYRSSSSQGCCYEPQSLQSAQKLAGFDLPRGSLQSVTSIKYYDENNVQQTLDANTYYHVIKDTILGRVVLRSGQTWPTTYDRPDAVEVVYVAGYGAAGLVPASLKAAVLMTAAHWFENALPYVTGTIVSEVPFTLQHLLWSFRIIDFET